MLALLLFFLAAPTAQSDSAEARSHMQRAYSLAQGGDRKAAQTELREAVRLAPRDPVALMMMGMLLSQPPRLEEANTWLLRALEIDPGQSSARYSLALNLFRLGKLDAAQGHLNRILKQDPANKDAASLLSAIKTKAGYDAAFERYRAGKYVESQRLLEQISASGTRDSQVLRLLAWCDHRQNRPSDAVAVMRQAIELSPDDAALYGNAAQMFLEERNYQAASAAAGKALQLAPDSVQPLKVKGLIDLALGDLKEALAIFRRAALLDPSDPEVLQHLGTAQRLLFQYADATATFDRAIAAFPGFAGIQLAYAKLLMDPGNRPGPVAPSRAAKMLEKALALDPSLSEAHFELGKLLRQRGDLSNAARHLEAAARLDPANPAIRLELAGAYRDLGRHEDQSKELARYRELTKGG